MGFNMNSRAMKTYHQPPQGFSLLELVIAVAVVGLLVAVALPSYGNYTRRALAAEGLTLAQPTLIQMREEVINQEYVPSPGAPPPPPPGVAYSREQRPIRRTKVMPSLSETVKSIVRHDLTVVINYTRAFDPEGQKEYSLVMSGTLANDNVAWTCKSGSAAAADLAAVASEGIAVGEPLPTKWAPGGC